jgi:hypothetical protein
MFRPIAPFAARAAVALALASSLAAQTTLFADDFESGTGNWSMTGMWRSIAETDGCSNGITPFPSSATAIAYNRVASGWCDFLGPLQGSARMLLPVTIPASASHARLRFWSYEETECGYGNCGWDHRFVDVSSDGGQSWTTLLQGGSEWNWYQRIASLDAYIGQDILVRFRFDAVDSWGNDFRGWLVDDVVIETDPVGTNYCSGKLSSEWCMPYVIASGHASLSGPDDLRVTADLLVNNVMSKLIWSRGTNSTPFHGGTLCVASPAARTTVTSSFGNPGPVRDCSGGYSFLFSHAYLASKAVVAGETIYVQASTRDPGFAVPNNHSLSDAVAIPILP